MPKYRSNRSFIFATVEEYDFVCGFCQKHFKSEIARRLHQKVVHKGEPKLKEKNICGYCLKNFENYRQLRKHVDSHKIVEEEKMR